MQPDYEHLLEMDDPLASRPMRFGPDDPRQDKAGTFRAWVYRLFAGEEQATPPLRLVADIVNNAVGPIPTSSGSDGQIGQGQSYGSEAVWQPQ